MVLVYYKVKGEEPLVITKEEKALLPKDVQEEKVDYLDGKLKEKLDFSKEQKRRNFDDPAVFTGNEGTGKSTIAVSCARYMSNDMFDPAKHMIGDGDDGGLQKLMDAEDEDVLVDDEFGQTGASTDTMTKKAKNMTKVFQIIRQKKLTVYFIIPSFFKLQSYFAVDRSNFMVRTYLVDGERSNFEYYGKKLKEKLYRYGKKDNNYSCVRPKFRGRFSRCYLLENKEYKDFKRKTLNQALKTAMGANDKPKTEAQLKSEVKKDMIRKNLDTPTIELSKLFGMTDRRVQQLKSEIREEQQGGSVSQ